MSVLKVVEDALRATPGLTLFKRAEFDEPQPDGQSLWSGHLLTVHLVCYARMRSVTHDNMYRYMQKLRTGCDDKRGYVHVRPDAVGYVVLNEVIGEVRMTPILHITDTDITLPVGYDAKTRKRVMTHASEKETELTRRIYVYVYPNRSSAAGVHGREELQPLAV